MRIVTFSHNGAVRHGVRDGDPIRIYPSATSAIDLATDAAAHPAGEDVALSEVTLLAPVPRPGKVICIGLNYRAHAEEGGNQVPDYPAVFLRGATSLVGPDAPIILPDCSDRLDYEGELAVVIEAGQLGERDVPDYFEPDDGKKAAVMTRVPGLTEVPYPVHMEPNLVIEFYSR